MDESTTSALPEPRPPNDRRSLDLRDEFVDAYGPRVFLALSAVGALFLLPFSVNNFVQHRWLLGSLTTIVALCLVSNAVAMSLRREVPFPPVLIFGPAVAALGVAMYEQGLIGILWSYAALLLFHFVLPRRTANWFNATIILLATVMAWTHLGPAVTVRVTATLVLTLLFANIFSWMSEAQRRKEAEHRERLDLLVRGTNAGTLEWDADGTLRYSKRLRRMLGQRSGDLPAFLDLVHPDDRVRVEARVLSQFALTGRPMDIVPLPPDDFRLLHASGSEIWVHTEGIAVTDARGRTRRCICSFLDMSERVQAELSLLRWHEQVREQARQLEEQNARLREAIRAREEVERIARHDLKTPLASIASVPRMLREGGRLGEREEELLSMVEHGALRVLSMVNLSLDLYRMEEGSYRLRPQPVDVAQVVRTVARELHGHADTKRLVLRLELPAGPALARGEELLCYSTVANLMKNAVEAAPDGSEVEARLVELDGLLQLAIHNEGAVPSAVRSGFFDKYTTHGKAGGTGLGAYSARLMARVQGGELRMETAEETGTTLTLALPAWGAAVQPVVPAPAPGEPRPESAPPVSLPPLSLLLVDDDPYNLIVLKGLLPVPPLKVREAINGRAALECVAAERPDIVFLDLQMPVMGGPEAIGRIRELQRRMGQPPSVVVAFSAWDDEATRRQCSEAGFDHYIVKPASREEVLALLRGPAAGGPVAVPTEPEPVDAEAMALMPEFVASRRELLEQLGEAARSGDRVALHATAHMLAGSLGMYGFDTASEMSRRLAAQSKAGELDVLRDRCDELTAQFERDQVLVQQGVRC